jgi:predicted acylesterase/phospholipase RssA
MSSLWREAADLVIEPDVAGFGYDDFKRADELIHVGEVAMREALPEVRKWLETPVEAPANAKTGAAVARPAPMPAD